MNNGVKKALIAGVFAVIVALVSREATLRFSANNMNSNTMIVNIDGGQITVTEDKYIEIVTNNGKLSSDNERLESENAELKSENESLKYKDENQKESNLVGDDNSQMINGEENFKVPDDGTKVKELTVVDSEAYKLLEPITDSYGNQYEIGYELGASYNGFVVYALQGKYSEFSCVIVCSSEAGSGANMTAMVYKDDDLIDTITGINKQTETLKLGPYDISDARKLIIKTSNEGEFPFGFFYLVEAYVR